MMSVTTMIKSGVHHLKSQGIVKTSVLLYNYVYRKMFGSNLPFVSFNIDDGKSVNVDNTMVNVAIHPNGGMGDLLISANYVYHLIRKFGSPLVRIYVVCEKSIEMVKSVFDSNDYPIVYGYCTHQDYLKSIDRFDLIIKVLRYPVIEKINYEKLSIFTPDLLMYAIQCVKYKAMCEDIINNAPRLDGSSNRLGLISGDKRMQQMDVFDILGISEDYRFPIRVNNFSSVKERYGLCDDYIVVHRGRDETQSGECNRSWPVSYYDDLIYLIKKDYPDVTIVQIGVSRSRCPHLNGVDVDIVGKTNFEDVKTILKNARLLIDSEGGMVHMRHALAGGTSVVLYGPSPIDFFGYPENINIVGDSCQIFCEWTLNCGFDICIRNHSAESICLKSITPDRVMNEISIFLKQSYGE